MVNMKKMSAEDIQALKEITLNYSQGTLDLVGKTPQEADVAIRNAMISLLGTANPTHREIRAVENTLYGILEVPLDQRFTTGWDNDPFFQEFVEFKDLSLGDTNTFYVEDKSRLIVSRIADGTLDLSRQNLDVGKSFSVHMESYGIKVYGSILRFLAGRDSFGTLVEKAHQAFSDVFKTEIYSKFMSTYDLLPKELVHEGNLSEDKLLDIVDNVAMVNQGSEIILAGTRKAIRGLRGLEDPNWISEEMKLQRNRLGTVRMWEGLKVMVIDQVSVPNEIRPIIDDNRILILPTGTKPIKFVREGAMIIDESSHFENYDMSKELAIVMKFGIDVIFNNMYGMYKIIK